MTKNNRIPETFSLSLFFLLLWLPMGQMHFLILHWMKIGVFLIPFLIFISWKGAKNSIIQDRLFLSGMMLISYIVHQFEEHWIDIYGNYYAFSKSVNGLLQGLTGSQNEILSNEGIFVINTSLVWLVGALAMYSCPRRIFPSLCMAGIILVNAVAHLAIWGTKLLYNPGVVTSLIIFMPISFWVYKVSLSEKWASKKMIIASLGWSFFAHILMIWGALAANHFQIISENIYFGALILTSLLPFFLAELFEVGDRA